MTRYVSPRQIVIALHGTWSRNKGVCRCPAHDDRSPSLSVAQTRDGRPLVHCHAGCEQMAVITALKGLGLWADGPVTGDPSYPGYVTTPYVRGMHDNDDRERRQAAQDIWDRGRSIVGTLAEAYLRARGIKLPPSDQLRYVPALKHSQERRMLPALIARVSGDRGLCAIQRTYLDQREPRKADVQPNKMTLGPMGDGAVRLREPKFDRLGIAEGVETALSAAQIYAIPVWASCGAKRLSVIGVPGHVRQISIFGDPGDVGKREALHAAECWERRGFAVEVYFPAAHFNSGECDDFNDVLRAGV